MAASWSLIHSTGLLLPQFLHPHFGRQQCKTNRWGRKRQQGWQGSYPPWDDERHPPGGVRASLWHPSHAGEGSTSSWAEKCPSRLSEEPRSSADKDSTGQCSGRFQQCSSRLAFDILGLRACKLQHSSTAAWLGKSWGQGQEIPKGQSAAKKNS